MTWLNTFYTKYKPNLDISKRVKRSEGFEIIFKELEKLNKDFYTIIETGTTRKHPAHKHAWKDGMGTLMFENFVNYHDGEVHTVDIDPEACAVCETLVGEKVHVHCMDSAEFLKDKKADFYYLDSWDVDRSNPLPSQEHHLKEFQAIEPYLKDCIVAIDDNFIHQGRDVGKGLLVKSYLANKRIFPIYEDYQIIYKF